MRWRPTLAALGVLAVVAALAVAMSSASSPTVSASQDDRAAAEDPAPSPGAPSAEPGAAPAATGDGTGGSDSSGQPVDVPEPDASTAADPSHSSGDAVIPAEDPQTSVAPAGDPDQLDARPDIIPNICPDPSDSFFTQALLEDNCYWLIIEEHHELTAEERELIGSVPFVAGYAAEPLGRPARKIRRGPAGDPGAPRLYLTFDDGPSTRWTRPTLDLLDRYGVRATFFPVGAYAKLNFHLIEEIAARGHTIGTHLWSHEAAALYDETLFRRELRATADLYGDYGTNCLRTPYGITNDEIFEWAGDEGFEVVLWGDVDPLDWKGPGIDELTRRILNGVQPGTILLLHERTGADTLAALDAVLGALADAGWRFDEPICPLQF